MRIVARGILRVLGWMENIEDEWPALKYLGFGCYYAWIFLCYSGDVLFSEAGLINGVSAQTVMYLLSTTALAVTLLTAAVFHKHVAKLVARARVVVGAAVVASLATGLVAWTEQAAANPAFWAGCALTGIGTAFVSLRFGIMYSIMAARKAMTNVAAAFALAGAVYFVVEGVPHQLALVLCCLLPLLAALFTALFDPSRTGRPGRPVVPASSLPPHFFLKLAVAISTFSAIAGFCNGLDANTELANVAVLHGCHAVMVFSVSVVALLLLAVGGAIDRDFDLSKLYYPIIVLACFGVVVSPLLGGYDPVQRTFVGAAYNLFILFVWCLLAHVASRTDLAPVAVFGWGRGASAVGTTIGWLGSAIVTPRLAEKPDTLMAFAVVMVFVLVVISMVVLKEGAIDQVLSQTDAGAAGGVSSVPGARRRRDGLTVPMRCEACAAGAAAESDELAGRGCATAVAGAGVQAVGASTAQQQVAPVDAANVAEVLDKQAGHGLANGCAQVAERFGLSDREGEVLALLVAGRTIEQISQELCVSFNTAKSHVRHVYTKTGVHVRKELFELVRDE